MSEVSESSSRWLQALVNVRQAERLNQLLSIISGGKLADIEWLSPLRQADYQQYALAELEQELPYGLTAELPGLPSVFWDGIGIYNSPEGSRGLLLVLCQEQLEELQAEAGDSHLLQAVQYVQQLLAQYLQVQENLVYLLLLHFSSDPDQEQPAALPEVWQWEQATELFCQYTFDQPQPPDWLIPLHLVVYRKWLDDLKQLELQ